MNEVRGTRREGRSGLRHAARSRCAAVAVATALATATLASAQNTVPGQVPHAPALVSWGKWGAAAMFVGFTAYGVSLHNGANADYRALVFWCQGGGGSCLLAPDGTYQDPHSEELFQSSIEGDKSARTWLIAGQVALVGAVALFIAQLHYSHGPQNIPYEPRLEVLPGPTGTRVGLRFSLRH